MIGYVRGAPILRAEHPNPEEFRERRRHITIKYFNEYLQDLEAKGEWGERGNLIDKINYNMFSNYVPNYANYPFDVKDLGDTFFDQPLVVRAHQKEGAAFLVARGLGYLAYEVGAGKTMTAILGLEKMLQTNRCKRPAIFAPKGVTKNFLREYRELFPKRKVVFLGNLGANVNLPKMEDGTVYVLTHEALSNITYSNAEIHRIEDHLIEQTKKDRSGKRKAEVDALNVQQTFSSTVIAGKRKMEDLGFDHLTYDEQHNFKNLFSISSREFSSLGGSSADRSK
jgi:N12 class adenine-specific DNA methylase